VVTKVTTTPEQMKTVAITIKHLNATFDPDAGANAFRFATDVEAAPNVVFRRYRAWVPEVGVAVIYNDLRYRSTRRRKSTGSCS
jgi:hypothetical protein